MDPAEPGNQVEIKLLGPVEVTIGHRAVALGRRKQRALLALLALNANRVVSTDRLLDALWGERPPPTAPVALYGLVSAMRMLLEPEQADVLVTKAPGYMLDLPAEQIDVGRFEQLAAEGRRALTADDADTASARLTEALALWRGPPLQDLEHLPFAQAEIGRLDELRLAVVEDRIAADLARGRDGDLVPQLESLVAEHPLRERACAQLMHALYRAGRQAEALEVYQAAREALVEGLGIEPGRQLRELHQQILRQDAALDLAAEVEPLGSLPERKHNLPAQLTSFIGREAEIAELKELLVTTRLLTLTGAGGSGKTRLALEVAADVVPDYSDGAWLVELAGLSDASLVTAVAARAVGIQEEPVRPLVETLADALRTRRLLLVLDNCEHLVAACASLAEQLLKSCPGLTVLATSREPLAIAGETSWGVPTLSVPAAAKAAPAEALASEAVHLFIERARSANRSLSLGDNSISAIVEICRRLDGIPLAIELAAVCVRLLTPEEIEARLDDRFALLTGGSRTALPRHRTLRALVDWSYGLLSEQERLLFWRLAVFAGGFSLDAAESVCEGEGLEADAVLELLAQLVDKSLLVAEERSATTRYRLLETMRQYAHDKLAQSGEEERLRTSHLEWFRSLAEQAEGELTGPAQRSWLETLEEEHDNMRAALEWSLSGGDSQVGLGLAGALGRFWEIHGHLSEGRRWLDALLEQGGARTTALRARALTSAGRLADRQTDRPAAVAQLEESLAIARTLGDRKGEALLLRYFGEQAYWPGEYIQACRHFEASLAISHELNDKEGICSSLEYLGMLAESLGDFALARTRFEQSLEIARELGERRAITKVLTHLGRSALTRGDYRSARALCQQGLAIAEELRDKDSIARALIVLSNLELALGDRATARSLYEERSAIWRELGAKWAVLSELSFGAILAREEEDYATARSLLEESVRIQREWDYNASMISDLTTLGDLARREGDRERATALLCEAIELASELGMKLSGCESIEALAKLAAAQGRDEQAVRLFGATDALREAIEAPLPPSERAGYDDSLRLAHTRLDNDAFQQAWAQGRTMSLETAIEEALTAAAAINGDSLPHRALTHPRPLQDSQKARNR